MTIEHSGFFYLLRECVCSWFVRQEATYGGRLTILGLTHLTSSLRLFWGLQAGKRYQKLDRTDQNLMNVFGHADCTVAYLKTCQCRSGHRKDK